MIRITVGEDFGPFDHTSVPSSDVNVVDPTLSPAFLEGIGFRTRVKHTVHINEILGFKQDLNCVSYVILSILWHTAL